MVSGLETARSLIDSARAVLCDLDGCLTLGATAAPGAAAFADSVGDRLLIVSNNSTHDEHELAAHLGALGIDISPERIVLAGMCALEAAQADWPGARVLILGTQTLKRRAHDLGLVTVTHEPDLLLVARDTVLTFESLDEATRAAARGCLVIVANPDNTHPLEDGQPTLETGAIVAALRAAVPSMHEIVIGKPRGALFRAALGRAGVEAADAVMIGDNPATDIAGAHAAGIPAILIGRAPGALARHLDELMNTATVSRHRAATA